MARGRRRHHRRHRAHHHHHHRRRQRQRRRHHHHHFRRRAAGGNGQNSGGTPSWRYCGMLLALSSIVFFIIGIMLIAIVGGDALTIGIFLLCGGAFAFFGGVLCLVFCPSKPETETGHELTQVSFLLIKKET